jgi:hypothetical protein
VRTADPRKAACVIETAQLQAFFKCDSVFESLLYARCFENKYANLVAPFSAQQGWAGVAQFYVF